MFWNRGELEKAGSSKLVVVNVRVIAATNKMLEEEIEAGRFREDLFFRLNVVPIFVPPLRERRTDIPLLVKHLADNYCREKSFPPKTFRKEVLDRFQELPWKGNIRELRNVVERLILMTSGNEIMLADTETVIPGALVEQQQKDIDLSLEQLGNLEGFQGNSGETLSGSET